MTILIEVSNASRFEFANPCPSGVEHGNREPIRRREQSSDSFDRASSRRFDLFGFLTRESNADTIARGIWRDACEVEGHRDCGDRFPDRLARTSARVQSRNNIGDVPFCDLGDGHVAKEWENPVNSGPVLNCGGLADIHTRRLPFSGDIAERRYPRRLGEQANVWHTHCGELTDYPPTARIGFALRRERPRVELFALAATQPVSDAPPHGSGRLNPSLDPRMRHRDRRPT